MTNPKDPYASEAETQALLVPDTRMKAERKLAQMMAERGADEQGAEAYPILWKIAGDVLEARPTFTGLPKRKLNDLLSAGWHINGVSIEREDGGITKRGAVTTGGMVLWWNAEQPAQQEPVAITVEQAHDMGAKGAEPTEKERLLFEAWMRGHCWLVQGDWDGKSYVHESENTGYLHPGAMLTRQLWAAWRDRAALAEQPAQRKPLTDKKIEEIRIEQEFDQWAISEAAFNYAARAIEAAHGIKEQQPIASTLTKSDSRSQCWKCGDSDPAYTDVCQVPACGMREGT